jgi:hypothetical protein
MKENTKFMLSILFILIITIMFSSCFIKMETFQNEFCDNNIGSCIYDIKEKGLQISEETETNHLERLRIRKDPAKYIKSRETNVSNPFNKNLIHN